MTVLGLKLSRRANAVSALHGEVSREMWTGLYPGRAEDAVPIGHITNGVHVPSWLAPQMFRLYDRHLGAGWHKHSGESRIWEGIENVDDGELWETHLSLKARLLDFRAAARGGAGRAARRIEGEVQRLSRVLSPDALTIGFARRFATYKRANLMLTISSGWRRWSTIPSGRCSSCSPARRIRGRTRQARAAGDRADDARQKFGDKFVFVEDYDINVGRHFVQGVDVWLNNPRRPLEASGTSGQKVVLNGGLNLSVLDGWWAEAYDGLNGFAIGTGRTHSEYGRSRHARRRGSVSRAARRSDSALLPARSRRAAARLDQAHEADDPHAGLALQCGPDGDGLHAEVLCSGRGRHFERYVAGGVDGGRVWASRRDRQARRRSLARRHSR